MVKRNIGAQGLQAGAIGLGCMGMSHGYGAGEEGESIAVVHRALELGVTLLDTAEVYGPYTNEELVGKAIRGRREQVVLATKFGIVLGSGGMQVDGSPQNAQRAVEGSLRRLGVETIDLYYLHRKDPAVPIEETVGAMQRLIEQGKVRFLGLSEVGAETIRRACAVHPISAVQSEYSLWERGIEASVLPAMRELGVGLVPFSPLGRGYLAGQFTTSAGFGQNDFRRSLPRFDDAHLAANLRLVEIVKSVAQRHAATPAQVALAWILQAQPNAVPIPGTKRLVYIESNVAAASLALAPEDMAELDGLEAMAVGDRYPPALARTAER